MSKGNSWNEEFVEFARQNAFNLAMTTGVTLAVLSKMFKHLNSEQNASWILQEFDVTTESVYPAFDEEALNEEGEKFRRLLLPSGSGRKITEKLKIKDAQTKLRVLIDEACASGKVDYEYLNFLVRLNLHLLPKTKDGNVAENLLAMRKIANSLSYHPVFSIADDYFLAILNSSDDRKITFKITNEDDLEMRVGEFKQICGAFNFLARSRFCGECDQPKEILQKSFIFAVHSGDFQGAKAAILEFCELSKEVASIQELRDFIFNDGKNLGVYCRGDNLHLLNFLMMIGAGLEIDLNEVGPEDPRPIEDAICLLKDRITREGVLTNAAMLKIAMLANSGNEARKTRVKVQNDAVVEIEDADLEMVSKIKELDIESENFVNDCRELVLARFSVREELAQAEETEEEWFETFQDATEMMKAKLEREFEEKFAGLRQAADREVAGINEQLQRVQRDLEAKETGRRGLQSKLAKVTAEKSTAELELGKLKAKNAKVDPAKLQRSLDGARRDLEKQKLQTLEKEDELELASKKLEFEKKERARDVGAKNKLEEENAEMKAELGKLRGEFKQSKKDLRAKVKLLEVKLDESRKELGKERSTKNDNYREKAEENDALKTKNAELESEKDAAEEAARELRVENEETRAQKLATEEEVRRGQAEIDVLRRELQATRLQALAANQNAGVANRARVTETGHFEERLRRTNATVNGLENLNNILRRQLAAAQIQLHPSPPAYQSEEHLLEQRISVIPKLVEIDGKFYLEDSLAGLGAVNIPDHFKDALLATVAPESASQSPTTVEPVPTRKVISDADPERTKSGPAGTSPKEEKRTLTRSVKSDSALQKPRGKQFRSLDLERTL